MARRRKTYVPRRKPKGLGKVIRRGTTRGRPRNFGQSAKRETSASRQLDNGIVIQPTMSDREKVTLLLREDFALSFDSDSSEESLEQRPMDQVKMDAVATSSTCTGSSCDEDKDEFGPEKKNEWPPLYLPNAEEHSEEPMSNSSSIVNGSTSGESQCSKSSLFSSSSEDESHNNVNNINLLNINDLKVPSRSILRKQDFHKNQHDLNQDKFEEPDYHELYLQKTKRNPKVPKGIHACPQCNKKYVYFSQLRQHLQRHAKWMCDVDGCGFEYHDRAVLVTHLTREHGRRKDELAIHVCPICSKCFGSAKDVHKHRDVHDALGKYACKHCGKQFFYWQSRKTHQRICTESNGKIRKGGGPPGAGVMQMEVEQQQKAVQPGFRVKRAYRRRQPLPTKKVTRAKNYHDSITPKLGDENENALVVKEDEHEHSDTPLDLSVKTGKFPPSAFNKVAKKRGKKSSEEGHDDDDVQPEVPSPPDWRQQQEVLQGVLGRQDWFQNVDMTNANPLLAQMCISYIEQVRQAYWGGYPYQGFGLGMYNPVLANYYYPQQCLPGVANVATLDPTQSSQNSYVNETEINSAPRTAEDVDIENS